MKQGSPFEGRALLRDECSDDQIRESVVLRFERVERMECSSMPCRVTAAIDGLIDCFHDDVDVAAVLQFGAPPVHGSDGVRCDFHPDDSRHRDDAHRETLDRGQSVGVRRDCLDLFITDMTSSKSVSDSAHYYSYSHPSSNMCPTDESCEGRQCLHYSISNKISQ